MSYRAYTPKRGDLVHLNFSPSAGHEVAERHYALVLSPVSYNRESRMAVVCPVASHAWGWPFEVQLPPGLLPPKKGVGAVTSVVVADAVRQVDYCEREAEYVSDAPRQVVEEVLDKLLAVLEEE